MNLPIDARRAPFREKYLDETEVFAHWFQFGRLADGTFCVSTSCGGDDVLIGLSHEQLARVLAARINFCREMNAVLVQPASAAGSKA